MDAIGNKVVDSEEGFTAPEITVSLARRQLHVSLGVACLMIAAAVMVVLSAGGAPRHGPGIRAELKVQDPQFVRPMTATATGEARKTGG